MTQKHYLITGGAGFIGSHLTERILKEGHRVTIIMDSIHDAILNCSQSGSKPQLDLRWQIR